MLGKRDERKILAFTKKAILGSLAQHCWYDKLQNFKIASEIDLISSEDAKVSPKKYFLFPFLYKDNVQKISDVLQKGP